MRPSPSRRKAEHPERPPQYSSTPEPPDLQEVAPPAHGTSLPPILLLLTFSLSLEHPCLPHLRAFAQARTLSPDQGMKRPLSPSNSEFKCHFLKGTNTATVLNHLPIVHPKSLPPI
jgi:hypothetical protein